MSLDTNHPKRTKLKFRSGTSCINAKQTANTDNTTEDPQKGSTITCNAMIISTIPC